jgi:hypothetical protein
MIDELGGTEADEDDGTGQPRQSYKPSGTAASPFGWVDQEVDT